MRDLRLLEALRITDPLALKRFGGWAGDETCGAFVLPNICADGALLVIASSGEGWDHVSVSHRRRCPTWDEMERVKRMFFRDDETAMQLHVPPSEHINCHPYCLHLWRPLAVEIPRPPAIMVGPTPTPRAATNEGDRNEQ